MNYILILLLSSAYCTVIRNPQNNGEYITPSQDEFRASGSTSNVLAVRIKRQVDVVKNSDNSYTINAKKDLLDDGTKKLSTFGSIDGLNAGHGFSSLNAGVDFKNVKGNELSILGVHTKTADKLSGEGRLHLLNTDTQSLLAKGFAEKSWENGDTIAKYGGSLNYLNKKGHDATLSAVHDSSLGDTLSAKGTYSFINTDDRKLNAKAFWNKDMPLNKPAAESYGGSLNYLNTRNGNAASILAQHLPDLGDQLSLAGKYSVIHNDNHDLHAAGQITRTFPLNPSIGNFNKYSGNLDYLYKNKVGLDLGLRHSDLSQRSDFSALGKVNLFSDRNTHFDAFGGFTRSISPNYNSPWGPTFGVTFSKSF